MTTSNSKTEAQLSAAFIHGLSVVNADLIKNDDHDTLTEDEALAAIKHSGKLFRKLSSNAMPPPFMLVPLCVLFAITHIRPIMGQRLARICQARLLCAALQYDICKPGTSPSMMRHYARGTDLRGHFDMIGRGTADEQTYLLAAQSIISAVVAESIFENIHYKPENLYKEFHMLNDHHGEILIKWMKSCDIPIANYK